MPKRRDPGRSMHSPPRDEQDRPLPDRETVERAIKSIVDRLKPKPQPPKPVRKARRASEPSKVHRIG